MIGLIISLVVGTVVLFVWCACQTAKDADNMNNDEEMR